jgi:hypothetical protein
LLQQVELSALDKERPFCWYATPNNEIRLDIAAFCVEGMTVTFREVAGEWVSGGEEYFTQICETTPG